MNAQDFQPLAPEDAPPRPLGTQRFFVLFAALIFVVPIAFGFLIVGLCGLTMLVFACVFTWRKWERIGWYELRPIETPTLPFRARIGVEFREDGAHFSGWRRHRVIAYGDIARVETVCSDILLSGVKIWLSDHDYYGADNAPELIDERSVSGVTSRQILVTLRQNAPHARFEGPQWIEEGWVPRAGFSLISQNSGASGGP